MAVQYNSGFTPVVSGTILVAVSATSTAYALASWPTNYPLDVRSVRVYNQGLNIVNIEFYNAATGIAATSGVAMPIAPGSVEVFGVNGATTHLHALATSAASLTSFTIGSRL